MKEFKDLQPSDIIYYYDHCKMKPREVVSCKVIENERRINTYRGYEVRIEKTLIIKCKRGYDLNLYADWSGKFPLYSAHGNCSRIFSCKEAAEKELKRLQDYRQRKINEAQERVNRYTNIMSKYEIL